MKNIIIFAVFLLLTISISFAELVEIDFDRLNYGKYILTYEEHYYDGVGESFLTIEKLDNGYLVVWEGITDTTTVHTDFDFNTLKMTITDNDTSITAERFGNVLKVQGTDEGKQINKKLTLKNEYWYQILSFSLIHFTLSNEKKLDFALFDPYNIKMRSMKIEKMGTEVITIIGKEISAVKLSMRMGGILSPFWKSKIWHNPETGIHLEYEGINVIPSYYKAKIILKNIDFMEVSN